MGLLISEIILCLFVAALFGFIIGWLWRGKSKDREIENLQNIYKANLYSREEELKAVKQALENCQSRQQELETPQRAARVVASPPGAPPAAAVSQSRATAAPALEEKDDLKEIRGIGPFLEKILNENGVYTYRQIARFTDADVDELSKKIGTFKNRIRRDNWIEQAKEQHFLKYGERLG